MELAASILKQLRIQPELISGIHMFARIQEGDRFTLCRRFLNEGAWAQIAVQLTAPKTGMIGIVTYSHSPKEWSPRATGPKKFIALEHFAAGYIVLVHNGTAMEFDRPVEGGTAGIFVEEKAEEEVKQEAPACYEDIDSDE